MFRLSVKNIYVRVLKQAYIILFGLRGFEDFTKCRMLNLCQIQ
jgi:hypothetical protein